MMIAFYPMFACAGFGVVAVDAAGAWVYVGSVSSCVVAVAALVFAAPTVGGAVLVDQLVGVG